VASSVHNRRMLPELVFVLPEDRDSISGGNLYNRLLCEALSRNGCQPAVVDHELAATRMATGRAGVFVVDSLLRERVPALAAEAGVDQPVLLLVHLLESFVSNDSRDEAKERELFLPVAGFVATSAFTRERLAKTAGHRPVFVVPPGLAIEPVGVRSPPDDFAGLVVGNLVRCKRQLEFLEQLDSRLADGDEFSIDLVGREDLEPDYAAACHELIAERPRLAGRVRIHGVVPLSDMPRWYHESTAFLSAAAVETYGMAVAEARALGVPVLAVDAGNLRAHVTDTDHGKLVGSVAELAEACTSLIRSRAHQRELVDRAAASRAPSVSTWDDAAVTLIDQLARWFRGLSS